MVVSMVVSMVELMVAMKVTWSVEMKVVLLVVEMVEYLVSMTARPQAGSTAVSKDGPSAPKMAVLKVVPKAVERVAKMAV